MATLSREIVQGLKALTRSRTYYAWGLLRREVREDGEAPTAWTDGKVIGVNPSWFRGLSLAERQGVLAHEYLHIALGHHLDLAELEAAGEVVDRAAANRAMDYVVNLLLNEDKMTIPAGGLLDRRYAGRSWLSIYRELKKDGQGQGKPKPGQGGAGAGAGTPQKGAQDGSGEAYTGPGEVRAAPGMTQVGEAGRQARAEARGALVREVAGDRALARAAGTEPAGLREALGAVAQGREDWRELLRAWLTERVRSDYSWRRPSRRHVWSGLYLPELGATETGTIAIVVDTSGSMTSEDLATAAGETVELLRQLPAVRVLLLHCDAGPSDIHELVNGDALPDWQGGGGTSYRPAFAALEEAGEAEGLAGLAYITDGYCSDWPRAADYPVLWAVTTRASFQPPFGAVLRVGEGAI